MYVTYLHQKTFESEICFKKVKSKQMLKKIIRSTYTYTQTQWPLESKNLILKRIFLDLFTLSKIFSVKVYKAAVEISCHFMTKNQIIFDKVSAEK